MSLYTLAAMGFTFSTYYVMNNNVTLDGFYEMTIEDDFAEGESRAV